MTKRLSSEDYDRIIEMRERGKSYAVIARSVGCSESNIYWHCLSLGVEPPVVKKPSCQIVGPTLMMRNGRPVRRFTQDDDKELLALEALGLPKNEIGRRIGRRYSSVHMRLMTLARRDARLEAGHGE